jgi:hypothetical protein
VCFLFFRAPLPPLDRAGPRRHRAAYSEIAGIFGLPPKSPVITVRPPAPPSVPGRTAFRTTPPPVATGISRWRHYRAPPDPPPGGDRYRCSSPPPVATGTSRWILIAPPSRPHRPPHVASFLRPEGPAQPLPGARPPDPAPQDKKGPKGRHNPPASAATGTSRWTALRLPPQTATRGPNRRQCSQHGSKPARLKLSSWIALRSTASGCRAE